MIPLLLLGCLSSDLDGDGWTVEQGDCDDLQPDVHPGIDEQGCSGIDEDCDGALLPCTTASAALPGGDLPDAESVDAAHDVGLGDDTRLDAVVLSEGRVHAIADVLDAPALDPTDGLEDSPSTPSTIIQLDVDGDGAADLVEAVPEEESPVIAHFFPFSQEHWSVAVGGPAELSPKEHVSLAGWDEGRMRLALGMWSVDEHVGGVALYDGGAEADRYLIGPSTHPCMGRHLATATHSGTQLLAVSSVCPPGSGTPSGAWVLQQLPDDERIDIITHGQPVDLSEWGELSGPLALVDLAGDGGLGLVVGVTEPARIALLSDLSCLRSDCGTLARIDASAASGEGVMIAASRTGRPALIALSDPAADGGAGRVWLIEAPADGDTALLEQDAIATLTGAAAEGLGTRLTFAPRDRDPEALLLLTADGRLLRWSLNFLD